MTYSYDAEGHLFQELAWQTGILGLVTTLYEYNGNNLWATFSGTGSGFGPQDQYLYGDADNQVLAVVGASASGIYLTDDQSSVRDVLGWSGQNQDHLDYSGFGVRTESNPSEGSIIGYAGYRGHDLLCDSCRLSRCLLAPTQRALRR